MTYPGKLIVFEGGEGSGKTTHAEMLVQYLRDQGKTVSLTLEPGGTQFGVGMRTLVLSSKTAEVVDPRAELFCFLADRAQHCAQYILPRLEAGEIVICDRFSGSTFAYQIGGRMLPEPELIMSMDAYARTNIIADMTVYLDIDPEKGILRKKKAGQELNRLDNEAQAFHERVHTYFTELAVKESWVVIPTLSGTQEENQAIIRNRVDQFFV